MFGTNNKTYASNNSGKGKFKAYRNRPGKRQGLLELFSFLLMCVSVPAFLGGVFSIFVAIAAFACGVIGLFAWTRRHAKLFVIFSAVIIAAAIVNIILRGTFNAQCMPFFQYSNQFTNGVLTSTDGSDINGNGYISNRVANPVNNNDNSYDNSIWCGDNRVVYITMALVILFALLAHLCALAALLTPKSKTPVAARTTETQQTHTRTEVAY